MTTLHAGAGARSDLAAPLLERALGICELSLGPEDERTGQCLGKLASALEDRGGAVKVYP